MLAAMAGHRASGFGFTRRARLGLILLLLLVAGVGFAEDRALSDARADFTRYAQVAANVQHLLAMDADVSLMLRTQAAFETTGDGDAQARMQALQRSLTVAGRDLMDGMNVPERHDRMARIVGLLDAYFGNFDAIVRTRAARETVWDTDVNPLGAQLHTRLATLLALPEAQAAGSDPGGPMELLMQARLLAQSCRVGGDPMDGAASVEQVDALIAWLDHLQHGMEDRQQRAVVQDTIDAAVRYEASLATEMAAVAELARRTRSVGPDLVAQIRSDIAALRGAQSGTLADIEQRVGSALGSALLTRRSLAGMALAVGLLLVGLLGRYITKPAPAPLPAPPAELPPPAGEVTDFSALTRPG